MPIEIPECFEFLFQPARYKVLHGGRGSGKSVNVARALLIQAAQQTLRVLCARELQSSIRDSVHKLLADEITAMGMEGFYEIQNTAIYGRNSSEFIFRGLRHSVSEIKSMQGIDRCWVEEAQVVSKASWEILVPTIRKVNSEIWVTFNPALEEDETYQRFVVNPPSGAVVRQVNWNLNPFFPEVLRQEMEELKAKDEDAWLNVWEGKCRHTLDGAIFAKEIRDAELENRIISVPISTEKPIDTFWDLGKRDMCSIWFAQVVGFEYHIVDFYENCGQNLGHYIKVLKEKPYTYGTHWLPHDADHDLLASERTITQQMRAAFSSVKVAPKTSKVTQVEAARTVFGKCWFDREKSSDGLQHLRHYQYEVDEETGQRSLNPMHDQHSHAADAFMVMATSISERRERKLDLPKPNAPRVNLNFNRAGAWMGR